MPNRNCIYFAASPKADKSELQAIERVFCNGRTPADPLLIGSVMSNIGYTEAASGITAITKVNNNSKDSVGCLDKEVT